MTTPKPYHLFSYGANGTDEIDHGPYADRGVAEQIARYLITDCGRHVARVVRPATRTVVYVWDRAEQATKERAQFDDPAARAERDEAQDVGWVRFEESRRSGREGQNR